MKKKNLLVFSIVMFFSISMLKTFGQGVDFKNLSIEQAIEKAKKENKYVFIDVYTNWCGPCKLMDKQVFPTQEVGDYFNSKFINLKINAELGEYGSKFAKKYKIRAYPTFIVLDSKGDLVHMFAGASLDGQTFINKIKESFDPNKAYGVLKKQYDSGKRDKKTVSAYLQALINTNTVKPNNLIDEYYNSLSQDDKISNEALFIFEKFAPLDSDRAKFFETNHKKFRNVIGSKKVDSILISKYELYFGMMVKRDNNNVLVEEINKKVNHLQALGISNLKTIPVYKSGALLKLKNIEKEDFIDVVENTIPKLTNKEKDLMMLIIIPGLKKILNQKEKEDLIKLVTDESIKEYIIRSLN